MARNPDLEAGLRTLLFDVASGIGRLVMGELRLARAEAIDGLRAAQGGFVKIVIALVLALVGANVLAGAAVAALAASGMGPAWAALIVGLAFCALAFALLVTARAALRLRGIFPERALHGLRQDAAAVRAGLSEKGTNHV